MPSLPYWRLSGFYFCYFAVVGALIPYWGLYLQSLQFSAQAIGNISALIMITRIGAPVMWGWLADRTGKRLRIIRFGSLCAALCFVAVLDVRRFYWMAAVVAFYSFFWNAILPQFEVVTLRYLAGRTHRYSQVRLWGSVGFIVSVAGLGWLFDRVDIAFLPYCILSLLTLIWVCSLSLREQAPLPHKSEAGGVLTILKQPVVLYFFLANFLLQISHGTYYTFYTLYLEGIGYQRAAIGGLWALGVVAEVVIFLFMHRLLPRFGLRNLWLFSLAMAVVRWWLTACYAERPLIMLFAQLLHAFTFGAAHAVAIEWVRTYFEGRYQGQGQAFNSALSFGAGGACGAFLSGFLWDWSPALCFAVSAVAAALALLIAWLGVKPAQTSR